MVLDDVDVLVGLVGVVCVQSLGNWTPAFALFEVVTEEGAGAEGVRAGDVFVLDEAVLIVSLFKTVICRRLTLLRASCAA